MKVSLIQMSVVPDKAANLAHARALIAAAAEAGADIAVLPEMFCCEYRNRAFVENRESAGGPAWAMLSAAAAENGVSSAAPCPRRRAAGSTTALSSLTAPGGR